MAGHENTLSDFVRMRTEGAYYIDRTAYIRELEAARGFADISFAPQLERYPDIGWAMLIELKYLKKEDDASPAALAAIRTEAIGQLDRYAAKRCRRGDSPLPTE